MPTPKRKQKSVATPEHHSNSATMQDIADALDLSVATVSRALRQVKGINSETRAVVHRTASELGYRLPQSYRNTQPDSKDLLHVGVFIETTQERVTPAYLTGIVDASMNLNISPLIHYVKPGDCETILDPSKQPAAMRSGLLSGAIMVYWWPTEVVKTLSKMMPVVSVMHNYPSASIDVVGIDNYGGIELLTRRLANLGHKRIGYIGRCPSIDWAKIRYGSFIANTHSLELDTTPSDIIDVTYDDLVNIESDWSPYIKQAAERTKSGVTAWICATEPAGWKVHEGLSKLGLKIPKDISITGFHRPTHRDSFRPDLTSVGASYEAIGAAAIRRLHYRIQNNAETSRTILFSCEEHLGASAGPAPGE